MSTETTGATFADVPQLYERHVFACFIQRPQGHPRGSCGDQGAVPLWERLNNKLQQEGLSNVGFTPAGCLGFCMTGPLMVVYPEGVWYRPIVPDDIDEIVETHLKGGKLVERLVIVLRR
jgi:(2Fe-2S) ferredoxin